MKDWFGMLKRIKEEIILIKNKKRTFAYTLAEMLLVMLIISLMILAIPPVTKKLYHERTSRRLHGRYECFRNTAGQIVEAFSTEGGATTPPKVVDKCTFTPPHSSIYVLIHAIGGGGGGAYVKQNPTDTSVVVNDRAEYGNSLPNIWPDWLREIRNNGYQFPNNAAMNMSNTTITKGNVASLQYGFAGLQGERISMFFSRMDTNVKIEMIPGVGGAAGTSTGSYEGKDGTDTIVTFVKTKDNGTEERTELIKAEAGTGGAVAGAAKVWLFGGYPSDYGLGEAFARAPQEANFVENIEGNTDNTLKSYIVDYGLAPGNGGGGAYSYINNTTSTLTYTIENSSVTSRLTFNTYLEKNPRANTNCTGRGTSAHTCNKDLSKTYSCLNGQTKSGLLCLPANGGTGAVVILW